MMSQVPRVQFQRRNVQDDTLKSLPSNVQDDNLKNVQGDTLKSLPSRPPPFSDPGGGGVSDNSSNVQGDTLKSLPSQKSLPSRPPPLSDPGEGRVIESSDNTVGPEAHEPIANTPMGRLRDLSLQLEGALPEAEVRNPQALHPKS